jgi:hypothetical protein
MLIGVGRFPAALPAEEREQQGGRHMRRWVPQTDAQLRTSFNRILRVNLAAKGRGGVYISDLGLPQDVQEALAAVGRSRHDAGVVQRAREVFESWLAQPH